MEFMSFQMTMWHSCEDPIFAPGNKNCNSTSQVFEGKLSELFFDYKALICISILDQIIDTTCLKIKKNIYIYIYIYIYFFVHTFYV